MADRSVLVRLLAVTKDFRNEMARAERSARGVGEASDRSARQASGSFDTAGKGASRLSTAARAGIAAFGGLTVAAGASMRTIMDFEKAMSGVQAATGAASSELDQLREAAMRAGADSQYSAGEAAAAITEMAKAGVATADILNGGLAGALDLAAAGQIEVADAAGIASIAMTQFNLAGEDLPHVADLLAAGAGKAMGSVGDLGAALNQAGLIASAAGLSIEETTGGLAAFASAGLIGSDAGTSFKTMLQALQAPSGKSAELMGELGINMYDANGNMLGLSEMAGVLQTRLSGLTEEQRNAALAQIFGTDAVRAANVLYKEGAAGIAEWTDKVNDAGFAQEQAAALTDNLTGDLERLGGAWDSFVLALGGDGSGVLRDAVQLLESMVEGATWAVEAWQGLPGPVQAAVAVMGAFVAFRGPLDSLWARAATGITSVVTGMGMATGATSGFTLAVGTARLAVAGLATSAAALAPLIAAGYAVKEVTDFANAGDNATEAVEAFGVALATLPVAERLSAYRQELDRYQQVVDTYESQDWFDKYIWQNPFDDNSEVHEAREAIDVITGKITDLESQTSTSMPIIGGAVAASMTLIKENVADAAVATEQAAVEVDEATQQWRDSLQQINTDYVDILGTYKGLLDEKTAAERAAAEETAASTEDASDSWSDYVTDVDVSLAELATSLEEQLTAQDNWRENIGIITRRGGIEVGQAIAAMGEEGVALAEKFANGTDAEFNRMADLIIEDTRRGGSGAAAALDEELKVMAAIGAEGGSATAASIAEKLGLGLGEVRRIASDYGVELATGLEPLLAALGQRAVALRARGGGMANADGNLYEEHQAEIAPGGAWRVWAEPETGGEAYIPLSPSKRPRSLNIWRETGKRLGVDVQNYAWGGIDDVPRPRSTAPFGPPISTSGDLAMQTAYDETVAWMKANNEGIFGGIAGTGQLGGGVSAMFAAVKAAFPQARLNSGYRPGDPGYHGLGRAIDLGQVGRAGGMGHPYLAAMNRWLHDNYGANLKELIYDGAGDDRPDLKNGRPLTYSSATRRQHYNHVHVAMEKGGILNPHIRDSGGPLLPGFTFNGTGGLEDVVPRHVTDSRSSRPIIIQAAGGDGDRPYIGQLTMPVMPNAGPDEIAGAIVHRVKVVARGGKYAGGR